MQATLYRNWDRKVGTLALDTNGHVAGRAVTPGDIAAYRIVANTVIVDPTSGGRERLTPIDGERYLMALPWAFRSSAHVQVEHDDGTPLTDEEARSFWGFPATGG